MTDADVDTSRVTVRTYVPAYQRDRWDEDAEELDMSRSEFVRSMVQAGRRDFDLTSERDEEGPGSAEESQQESETVSADPGGLEDRVLGVLDESEHMAWDELVAALTDDIERRLEATLQDLQADNRIRYSGRNGGYTLDDE